MVITSYERKGSPWVWIQYGQDWRNKRFAKSTVRTDDPNKKRKILRELNRYEAILLAEPKPKAVTPEEETTEPAENEAETAAGWKWAKIWLASRYAGQTDTYRVYRVAWRWMSEYLVHARITSPLDLDREKVYEYVPYRMAQVKEKSGRSPCLNTCILELKVLAIVMDEAVRRAAGKGITLINPARKLGIKKEDSDLRPEYTDGDIAKIRAALKLKPQWMQRSWELALLTGMRFGDTSLHRRQVRWGSKDILVEKPKGGRKKEFTIPIYGSIRPMLESWRKEGTEHFWQLPPKEREMIGLEWTAFFRSINMRDYCFHCTRVTFITRGMRGDPANGIAGVPETVMCKMVNHASKLINRIYQRWTPDDVRAWGERVAIP